MKQDLITIDLERVKENLQHFTFMKDVDVAEVLKDLRIYAVPPTPAGSPAQHKIVEAVEVFKSKIHVSDQYHAALTVFAQAIEAEILKVDVLSAERLRKINALEAEIGEVRNKIAENMRPILAAFDLQYESIGRLKRKVEELEKKICDSTLLSGKPWRVQASPSRSETAQAPDEKGDMHDLIPGRSFYKTAGFELVRFKHTDGYAVFGEALLGIENRVVAPAKSEARTSNITFLFDLSVPGSDK